jgi:hypothetical protein
VPAVSVPVVGMPAVSVPVVGMPAVTLPAWVEYVAALGPLIVLAGALVGAVLAWSATRRDRWWARTQWAVDHVLGDNTGAQVVALAVLGVQVRHARSAEEAGVIGAVSDTLLEPLLVRPAPEPADVPGTPYVLRTARPRAAASSEPTTPPPGRPGSGTAEPVAQPVPVSAVERDAARLRVQVDARLGRPPSATVAAIARAAPG